MSTKIWFTSYISFCILFMLQIILGGELHKGHLISEGLAALLLAVIVVGMFSLPGIPLIGLFWSLFRYRQFSARVALGLSFIAITAVIILCMYIPVFLWAPCDSLPAEFFIFGICTSIATTIFHRNDIIEYARQRYMSPITNSNDLLNQ